MVKNRIWVVTFGFILFLFFISCESVAESTKDRQFTQDTIDSVHAHMRPLEKAPEGAYDPAILEYFKHYNLTVESPITHRFGYIKSQGFFIAAHWYLPENPKATVFLLHGYLTHTGYLHHVIHFLLENGYAVASMDLPGHGFSTGKRASIGNFHTYAQVLDDFINASESNFPEPFHVIGHSTGCSAIIEHMYTIEDRFDKVILTGPLVRNVLWGLSMFGNTVFGPFLTSVPNVVRRTTSNEEFNEFKKQKDPFLVESLPLEWVDALSTWYREIQKYPVLDRKVIIIQGKDDTVVDWEYNVTFLKGKFDTEVHYIPKAGHDMHNEITKIRNKVLTIIEQKLSAPVY